MEDTSMSELYDEMVPEASEETKELWRMPLDDLAAYGAEVVLKVALDREVEAFLGRERYERREEARKGYRNGHAEERGIQTRAGSLRVRAPRVSGSAEPFQSRVLPRFARKSEAVISVIPKLYLEGLSTRDFRRTLQPLWKGSGLSRSSVSRCNRELKKEFEAWRRRDLSGEELLVIFADGFYVGMRRGTSGKDALLVVHGVRKDGSRVVLGMSVGGRESTEAWKLQFNDLRSRGLRASELLVVDGNPGLLRAARDVFPESALQRCIVHRMRNVLARVPRKHQHAVGTDLRRIFYAACEADALMAAAAFARKYAETFTGACEVLGTDLADCLVFYRFPEKYWKRIRTTNVIERAFREVRRRSDVIGRFPDETSALFLAWGVLEHARVHWHKLRVKPADVIQITEARRSLQEKPIVVRGFEELNAA